MTKPSMILFLILLSCGFNIIYALECSKRTPPSSTRVRPFIRPHTKYYVHMNKAHGLIFLSPNQFYNMSNLISALSQKQRILAPQIDPVDTMIEDLKSVVSQKESISKNIANSTNNKCFCYKTLLAGIVIGGGAVLLGQKYLTKNTVHDFLQVIKPLKVDHQPR